MNITTTIKLSELYAACPKCGCEVVGNGKGALEFDTAAGFFRRTCACGWHVEVRESSGAVEDPPADEPPPDPEPAPSVKPEHPPADCPPADEPRKSDPAPVHTKTASLGDAGPEPWKGFVHIQCEVCRSEVTVCLRAPTTQYQCRECGHLMELPEPRLAYTKCECGKSARYLTNVTDPAFDIPCVVCGSPNAVLYDPRDDCYVPANGSSRRHRRRKKK